MTFPKAKRPQLMEIPSLARSPVAPVRLSLSDPAKSTKWNFAVSDSMSSGFAGAFMVQIWEIFHVHLNMYFSYRKYMYK